MYHYSLPSFLFLVEMTQCCYSTFSVLSVLYLASMIGFIQCFFAMKMWRFKTEHSSTLCGEETAWKKKCYSNWTRLYYRGNTSSKMLLRRDECRPRFYLGKDEVECGNTASMTRGGPAVRTRQMGQYFQAVL